MLNGTTMPIMIALVAGKTGTDKEVADELNAKTVMRYRGLNSSELNAWAAGFPGTRKSIFVAAADYEDPNYEVCAAAKFAMENTAETLHMSNPAIRGMVALLPISDEAKAAVIALAEAPISTAQEAGVSHVREGYVKAARLKS